jgi:hypothetical protein
MAASYKEEAIKCWTVRNRGLDARLLDRIGRIAGWYVVVGIGVKALQPPTDADGLARERASESEDATAAYRTSSTAS